MRDATDYLAHVKALIVANRQVVRWEVFREEAQGDMGLLRYRLNLSDGGLLEIFERFRIVEGVAQVEKYRIHWQDAGGRLIKRWDNAPHHPEVATHPHHVHDGSEENVEPSEPISVEKLLSLLAGETKH